MDSHGLIYPSIIFAREEAGEKQCLIRGIELQYAGDGQFRITRARGRVEVDGTVISEILPRRL